MSFVLRHDWPIKSWSEERFFRQGPAKPSRDSKEPKFNFQVPLKKRMSYRRRRRNFKKPYGRKYYGRRPNAGRIALRKVNQLIRNKELKMIEASDGTDQIPVGGAAQIIGIGPYCAGGTSDDDRIGDKITLKSIAMKFQIALSALEALGTVVRMMLIYDRRSNGADAAVSDVLTGNTIFDAISRDGPSRGRFQVLFDRVVPFDSTQTMWAENYYKKMNLQCVYSGNAGTVADLDKGNFLLITMAKGNAAPINVNFGVRFLFNDD